MGGALSLTRSRPRTLTLVIPAYNEEESLPELRAVLEAWIPQQSWATDVVVTNDGSSDGTGRLLEEWAASARWLKAIHLSRNFGHQAALTAGLDHADGEVVVIIDADLQDPLEVIPSMVDKYCEGFDVVYGRRAERHGETAVKRATAWLFYRAMQKLIYKHLPPDAGDFRLVSKRCLIAVLKMRETHRFLRGMFSWAGFKQTAVSYSRQPRKSGTTKYNYRKMALFAWNAVLSFSPLPLRIILIQGVLVAAFGIGYTIYSVMRWAFVGDTVAGWPTLVSLLGLIGGAILVALGLIGKYISRIYEELKDRPLYIISHTNNFNE